MGVQVVYIWVNVQEPGNNFAEGAALLEEGHRTHAVMLIVCAIKLV
jgi:hypothetical protein